MAADNDEHEGQGNLNPIFVAITRFALDHPILTILFYFFITGVFFVRLGAHPLPIDNRAEVFQGKQSNTQQVLDELREEFGRDDLFLVIIEGDVFTLEFLDRLKTLHDELATIDIDITDQTSPDTSSKTRSAISDEEFTDFGGDQDAWADEAGGTIVDEIISLVNVRETRASPDGITVGQLLDQWPTADDLTSLKARVLSDTNYANRVVGKAGKHAVILIRTHPTNEADTARVYHKIHDAVARHRAEGFFGQTGGAPSFNTRLNELSIFDMAKGFGGAMLVMILVLLFLFRHWTGVVGPVLVIFMVTTWTMGLMSFLDMSINYITSTVPIFLVPISLADAIHVQSMYRDNRKRGMSNEEAIITTMGITGIPILYTTVTTMIGMLSFQFASIQPVIDLGSFAAFGVGAACIITVGLIPVFLSCNKTGLLGAKEKSSEDHLDRFLLWCNRLSGTPVRPNGEPSTPEQSRIRCRNTILVGATISAVSLLLAPTIMVTHDPLTWFPAELETRSASDALDEHVGGAAQMNLLIETPPGTTLRSLKILNAMQKLEQHILAYRDPHTGDPIVANVVSILDVIRETNRAVHGGKESEYRLPDTERGLSDVLFLFESASPDQLRRLATNDLSKAQMTFTLKWLHASAYVPFTEHIQRGIDEHVGDLATFRPTGLIYSLLSTMSVLVPDLVRSFGIAFFVITLFMVILLRDLKMGLISMVPNLIPIIISISVMAIAEIPLDGFTILVASIALGLCVDDTIHFIHHIQEVYRRTGNIEAAISASLEQSGRAIVSTSVILILGISPTVTATLYSMLRFGLMVMVTILFALFADLILTPAVVRLAYRSTTSSS